MFNPLSPHDALKHHFTSLKTLNFSTTEGFRTKISMKLVYQYMANFCNFFTLNHLHPLQVENCDSNSWLVVDEDDNGKLMLERVKFSRCIKASSYIPENRPNFPTTNGFRKKIFMKLVHQYMAIF